MIPRQIIINHEPEGQLDLVFDDVPLLCRTVGKQLYESGDVEAAIACLEAAVEHDQNTLTLVNIGMFIV